MSNLKYVALSAVVLLIACEGRALHMTQVDPSKTTYGQKNLGAPNELAVFSFLVGKWQGTGPTRVPDGKLVEIPNSWIGRYVLDGTAIAVEMHSVYPDGRPALGITLWQYDASRKTWIVEFLNVSESFLRKQVNAGSGSVTLNGRNVTVSSESPGISVREHYSVADQDHFVYRMDVSTDGGHIWNEGQIEMSFRRSE